MEPGQEAHVPRVPWWVSAPLGLLLAGLFAYFFFSSIENGDPPWDPPWLAAIYRLGYAVLALLFLLGAVVAVRGPGAGERR